MSAPSVSIRTALPMAAILGVLGLLASAAWVVGLWKDWSTFGFVLSLVWAAVIVAAVLAGEAEKTVARIAAVIVILIAIEIRLQSIPLVDVGRIGADAMNYANLAQAILDGRGLITDDWRYGEGLRAYFPPLYPVVLAGWWGLFGSSAASTLAMNTVLGGAAAFCLRDIARRLGMGRAGDIAALMFFAWPSFALAAALPNKETVMLLFFLLFFRTILAWRADPGRRWLHSAVMGLLWGLMALTQAALALMPPVIGLLLMPKFGWRETIGFGLRAVPFFFLTMAPWWIRNWMIFGTFVPFTTAAGFLVNVALDKYALPIPLEVFELPEPERSGAMARLAFARIGNMPLNFLESVFIAFGRGFGYEEATIASFRHSAPPIEPALRNLFTPPLQFAWACLLIDAALAFWRRWRDRSDDLLIPMIFAVFVSICSINMWFEFGERHRLILTPLLILLVARRYGEIAREP